MNNPQSFQILEPGQKLNSESADQPVVETLIIVHLDKFVQVDREQVKHKAQVVAPDKVVRELDHSLQVVRVVLLQQQKELGLDSGLIVVLFLIFYNFDRDRLLRLVIKALEDVSESALSDDFDVLVPVRNLVALLEPVIAFVIIETIIDQAL